MLKAKWRKFLWNRANMTVRPVNNIGNTAITIIKSINVTMLARSVTCVNNMDVIPKIIVPSKVNTRGINQR